MIIELSSNDKHLYIKSNAMPTENNLKKIMSVGTSLGYTYKEYGQTSDDNSLTHLYMFTADKQILPDGSITISLSKIKENRLTIYNNITLDIIKYLIAFLSILNYELYYITVEDNLHTAIIREVSS